MNKFYSLLLFFSLFMNFNEMLSNVLNTVNLIINEEEEEEIKPIEKINNIKNKEEKNIVIENDEIIRNNVFNHLNKLSNELNSININNEIEIDLDDLVIEWTSEKPTIK